MSTKSFTTFEVRAAMQLESTRAQARNMINTLTAIKKVRVLTVTENNILTHLGNICNDITATLKNRN